MNRVSNTLKTNEYLIYNGFIFSQWLFRKFTLAMNFQKLINPIWASDLVTILKPPVPNPHSTRFTHGATCCWLRCTIPPYSAFPSSSRQIHPYSPFTSPISVPPLGARQLWKSSSSLVVMRVTYIIFMPTIRRLIVIEKL